VGGGGGGTLLFILEHAVRIFFPINYLKKPCCGQFNVTDVLDFSSYRSIIRSAPFLTISDLKVMRIYKHTVTCKTSKFMSEIIIKKYFFI